MQQTVRNITEGKFNYDRSTLVVSVNRIELSLSDQSTQQGSFSVSTDDGQSVKGMVFSSSMRMQILTSTFEGKNAEIYYSFKADGLEEGDIEKGEISIISSAGECVIPYSVSAMHGVISSSMGPVKNLFHFANLAKSNWSEAVSLFYSSEFTSVFHGNDLKYLGIYRGLSRIRGNEQNVDSFLNAINKKQKIEYLPMEEHIRIEDPYDVEEGKVTITRNGWGLTALAIETDGDFLSTEKNYLTDDNFLGNICTFSYYVDSSKLHAGNNYGKIHIYSPYTSIEIPVLVTRPYSRALRRSVKKQMQELTLSLMEYYTAFRLKKISSDMWLKNTADIVDRMNAIDEKNLSARMFQAQILITQDRVNEAKWILGRVEAELEKTDSKPEEYCYYLYLTSLVNRDEEYVNQVTSKVEDIYARYSDNWRIAWLLLYLREEFAKSPYKKWMFLEQQFYGGCISPVLYVEALTLLNANPTLLMKLTEYELQILNFAAKKELLKRDLILQIHALVQRTRTYSSRLLFILEKCYQVAEDDDTLELICTMLIRGNKTSEKEFAWYSLGVERELRVTRLFEYYMMAIPESYTRELPKMIMMYFAYHSELSYDKKAFLYANVYRYRDKFPEIYDTYRTLIEEFVIDQIRQSHITRDLAYLYKELVNEAVLRDEQLVEAFVPILFSHLITVNDESIRQLVIIYDKLKGEMTYPVVGGKAIVPVYSSDYSIVLQDAGGNRIASEELYDIEKLMIPGRFIKIIGERVSTHLGLDLHLCGNTENGITITVKNAVSFRRLWKSDRITEAFRKEIRLRLAKFYYENDLISEVDEILADVSPATMGEKERAEFLQLLVNRGMYDVAYSWLAQYGEGLADGNILIRLVSRLIVRMEYKEDDTLLTLAFSIFRKKRYDENLLRYLIAYYQGTIRNLRDLWKAGSEFDLDVNELCERIIVQYLFTGCYVGEKNQLFYSYVKNGAKKVVEIAFLTSEAQGYFEDEQVMDSEMWTYYTRLFYRGEELQDVCKLAYLKYYADRADRSEETLQLCVRFLEEFMGKSIVFPFFRNYGKVLPSLSLILDQTMIEYHAEGGTDVTIHYCIERGTGEAEYLTIPMKRMYRDIYVYSFVLFFGETLQYYITENRDGEEQLTQSDTISKNDTNEVSPDSRYALLNDMMVAGNLGEYMTFNSVYENYSEKKYVVGQLFRSEV